MTFCTEKRTVQEEKNSINKVTSEKIPNLTKKLSKLLNSFRSLSDKCLLTLKLEYRIRCYFFLDSVRHVFLLIVFFSLSPS